MSTHRTIAAAGLAALALAGGTALVGSSAHAEGQGQATARPPAPARALVASCDGHALLSMRHRDMDAQSVPAGTTADLEGSQWSVTGPRTGTDTILVTVSAMVSPGGASDLTGLSFYKDGVGTTGGSKYFGYGTLSQGSAQFCTKIGHGLHTLSVKVVDYGGGGTYLYYPTVTYERFS
jgi:hypothetical protein